MLVDGPLGAPPALGDGWATEPLAIVSLTKSRAKRAGRPEFAGLKAVAELKIVAPDR